MPIFTVNGADFLPRFITIQPMDGVFCSPWRVVLTDPVWAAC
jgi:hypothetical protein